MIICFFSGEDSHNLSEWHGLLQALGIQVVLYRMDADWESDTYFIDSILTCSNYLIIVSNKVIQTAWFKFLSGFCLGKHCQLFLYLMEPDIRLPLYLEFAKYGSTPDELKNHLIGMDEQLKREKQIESAKYDLSEQGIHYTPLHFFLCIERNYLTAVHQFLIAGTSPDAFDDNGIPALCLAARLSHNDICSLLLEYQCDINVISKDNGNNALMEAATHRNFSLAKILIERHINLDVQSKNGQTALMLAVGTRSQEIVELLLKAKANTEFKDVLGMTAGQYAKTFKYKEIFELFEQD
jgi:hypothetical protein